MSEKLICGAAMLFLALLLAGCDIRFDPARTERELAYSEAVNMNVWPQNYVGKTRTVTGESVSERFAVSDKTYHFVAVPNADGTYAEKIEYLSSDGCYPADGAPVTVTGEFEVFLEYGIQYCRLKDAAIITNEGDSTT